MVEFEYNMAAVGIPLLFLLMLVEYLALKLKGKNLHTYSDSVTSASMGACLLISEALLKVYTFGVFIWIWDNFRLFDFSSASLVTWVVFFFGTDLCYYWFHRIAHERNILWGAHEGHHQGEEFNYVTAIRQSAFQYGFSWVFYLPLALFGCPPEVFLGQFVILKGYQFWIHTQGIDRIPFIEGILSTPSSHRVHHAKNPIYIDRNYGGTLVIWDRMFGSWQPELATEACHYGTTNPTHSLSPIKLNLRHWGTMFSDAVHTKKWSDKIGLWFKPTGWRPADCVEPHNHLQKEGTADREKYDPKSTTTQKVYAGVSTLLTFVAAVMFIFLSPQLDGFIKGAGALILLGGVVAATGLLENKPQYFLLELVRLPAMVWFIATLWFFPVTTTIVNTIVINKPAAQALNYASDVSRWPEWHPQSETIAPPRTGSLLTGDAFTETVSTPAGQNDLVWKVEQAEHGSLWQASADNLTNGSQILLTYRTQNTGPSETTFERTLDYTLRNFALVAANALHFKKVMEEKSEQSLERLKCAIEQN
ncbi:sterol desaturase family protein [Parendozoicomonas haliclonae]|uniref:Fatty acid hydroxylase superfamily protein n=1 Tax=Parendozoicomonas haliclonae TaxID=1960125 RepID=A0A1X7AFE9_9GAMM|nr:sterol desaturase family protein [Parendozoicomonas haliclonae]SMA35561.1 Fatty acid hydroxylase superfamily protein [Parendozoicomonas haliclonae]